MSQGCLTNAEVKALIADLRGGIPEKCDFCYHIRKPEQLHPDEGGDWICDECIDRLGY